MAANVVKLCGNFLIGSALETMAEALNLVEKNGLDRKRVIKLFSQIMFTGPIYQNYGTMIAEKRYPPVGFEMRLALKDIRLVLDTAERVEMSMPFASCVHDRLLAGVAKGRGRLDWTALAQLVEEDAGQRRQKHDVSGRRHGCDPDQSSRFRNPHQKVERPKCKAA